MHRVCLFSSYFNGGDIPEYVKYYVSQLRPHFDHLVFITNEEKKLTEDSIAWLQANTDQWMEVKNEGYDFGMWQKALATLDQGSIDELCLANDSCVCIKPLSDVMHSARSCSFDVVGLVKSFEVQEHLQSYFLVLKARALPLVFDFLNQSEFARLEYGEVVLQGEIRLSRLFRDAGFKLHALFGAQTGVVMNPSFCEAIPMLQAGIPLIKRKLFIGIPSKPVIRWGIDQGVTSNPLCLFEHAKAHAADEVHGFLEFYKPSFVEMLVYYRCFVRLWVKKKTIFWVKKGWSFFGGG